MSAFIATGNTEPFQLSNDGWFPDIDANAARDTLRLDGSVTDTRLEAALVNAMLSVNDDLSHFKAQHLEQYSGLAAIPGPEINGQSRLVVLYTRAVICSAGAELVERYRSYDTSTDGDKNADKLTPTIDELRRDARWAVRDLLGKVRSTVVLI
ncbi:head completion/stabilization protein [Pseudomonas jilinensis]|uniref:Head completion/stabilization protein n=1 Tax=Pseudomonas jilinensis TaxID=2078689 RepID=A0A396RZK6_9PSED|nr:head completion/stabilization protein [Pseudomonas jilinensis]RHW21686.1 head completion/stabilization protein [Pseudomonas jilinensis]